MVSILRLLDSICSQDELLMAKSTAIMDPYTQLSAENTQFIESPHSYPPNTLDEKRVHIPGATHLCITFDPKCHTERGRDTLTLLMPNGTPICDSLHGESRLWPRTSLIVQGNEIVFRFKSDANTDARQWWGYGALITVCCILKRFEFGCLVFCRFPYF